MVAIFLSLLPGELKAGEPSESGWALQAVISAGQALPEALSERVLPRVVSCPFAFKPNDSLQNPCTATSSDQLVRWCVQSDNSVPLKRVAGARRLNCISSNGERPKVLLAYDYWIGVQEGRVVIRQDINFDGLTRAEDREVFRNMLEGALPAIVEFYDRHGIDYELRYALLGESGATPLEGRTIRVSFGNAPHFSDEARSRANDWKLQNYDPRSRIRFGEFSRMATHELLHGMGLPDDYVDPALGWCANIYGENGLNASRPFAIPCSEDEDATCINILQHGATLQTSAIPTDHMMTVLSPICPLNCSER